VCPDPPARWAVTARTFNQIVVGVMGRALEVSPLEVCACVWASNHYHLLVVAHEQQELSRSCGTWPATSRRR